MPAAFSRLFSARRKSNAPTADDTKRCLRVKSVNSENLKMGNVKRWRRTRPESKERRKRLSGNCEWWVDRAQWKAVKSATRFAYKKEMWWQRRRQRFQLQRAFTADDNKGTPHRVHQQNEHFAWKQTEKWSIFIMCCLLFGFTFFFSPSLRRRRLVVCYATRCRVCDCARLERH